jgi:hypothetical protein
MSAPGKYEGLVTTVTQQHLLSAVRPPILKDKQLKSDVESRLLIEQCHVFRLVHRLYK